MKITKYVKKSKDKYILYLDNGEIIDIYEDVIVKNNLTEGKYLDNNIYNKINKDNEIQKSYNECLRYINTRLRSVKEIKDYLIKKKISNENIDIITKRLLDNRLLDDDVFCEAFINDKMNLTSMGEYKIISELKRFGIDNNIIDKYYYLFDKEILQNKMDKLINKYLKSSKNKDKIYIKNKIYNNLMNQGYSKDMIMNSLGKIEFDE